LQWKDERGIGTASITELTENGKLTHTLHRRGKVESLKHDYVFLIMSAKGINDKGSGDKLARSLEIMSHFNPVNMGDMRTGNIFMKSITLETLKKKVKDTSIVHAVFTDEKTVTEVLPALKKAELGMSVVISGPFKEVFRALRSTELKPHTVELSLGVWGKLDLLPSDQILQITTMCGHSMIHSNLVKMLAQKVKDNSISLEEASQVLSKYCICGIFNPARASELLRTFIAGQN